jgi:MoxR-like ATPase
MIFNIALFSKKPVHILLVGPPGSAKTMFLSDIRRRYKESYFVVGSNTTKAGFLNVLFERSPTLVLIDELEKMNRKDQNCLLHLMETGIISETKVSKTRQMELLSSVFASANSCENISEPLLSRFIILKIPEYTYEEFKQISVIRLKDEGIDEKLALMIAQKVWCEFGSKDVRDALKVGRLASNIQEAEYIVKIMKSYSSRQ